MREFILNHKLQYEHVTSQILVSQIIYGLSYEREYLKIWWLLKTDTTNKVPNLWIDIKSPVAKINFQERFLS